MIDRLERLMRPKPRTSAVPTRIAFVSPLPPAKTGIASYSASVLHGLEQTGYRQRRQIRAIWPVRPEHDVEFRAYRLGVFHIGNNVDFHADIYRLVSFHAGVVVLHDLGLDEFVRGLIGRGDPLGYRAAREAALRIGELSLPEARIHEPLARPWCAHVARCARGIIVHSEFGRRYLQDFGCRTPVFVVPHPPVEREDALRRAEPQGQAVRRRLGLGPDDVLLVAPGDLNEAKCLDVVLAAAARLGSGVRVALVGRRIPNYDIDAVVRASGLGERVTLAPDVSDDDFRAWLHAADVILDLRFPHRGEVSGTLLRAMQVGRATVVSATGTYLDLPEDVVVHVGEGRPSADELAAALRRLVQDPDARARYAGAARRHVESTGGLERTARGYEEAIERTLALALDPRRKALARWARALKDLELGPEHLQAGWGLSYVRALEELTPRGSGSGTAR